MSKILIDHREDKKLIRELIKKKLDIQVRQLNSADIVFEINNNSKQTSIGIEIKKQNDFLNSIIDKRLISQLISLKENFSIPILLIEGSENLYEMRNFHPNSIRGMISSIAIDFQIPIIYTRNQRDTAAFIHSISKRIEAPIKNLSLIKKKKPLTKKELQEYIIESFPGVGPTLSKNLLKKFKSIKKIVNAKEDKLKKIKKLGPKKAKEIESILNEKYQT